MKKSRQNILNKASAVLFFSIAIPAIASAQILEAQSAAEFAESLGGEGARISKLLNKQASEESGIICGSLKTICDRETEYCLKCSYSYEMTGDSYETGTTVLGVCVSKNSVNLNDLKSSFPGGCGKTEKKGLDAILSFQNKQSEGEVTIETADWIDHGEHEQFGYKSKNREPFKAADGKSYTLLLSSNNPSIAYGENSENSSTSFTGCEVLPIKLYNMQNCFFCPLAAVVFGASNNITVKAFSIFAKPFAVIVGILFALWLALLALKQVFSMTKQDAPKFLTTILKQGFKVALAILLLTHSADLFRYFIIPVLDGGLQMGTQILTVKLPARNGNEEAASTSTTDRSYFNMPIARNAAGEDITLYSKLETYLRSIQYQLSYMQAIGTSLFCVGGHEIFTTNKDDFMAGLGMMGLGTIFVVFGFLLTITFAFYFLDALLQLSVIGAMMPLMIAGWPFRATAQYASTGFKLLLNTFFVMFFTGFVISVNIELINQSMSYSQVANQANTNQVQMVNNDNFNKIALAINEQNIDNLKKATDIGGVGFLLIIFSCLFGYKFVAQVNPLAAKLADGGVFAGMTGKIGSMAASTIKGAAGKVAQPFGAAFTAATGGVAGIAAGAAGAITSTAGSLVSTVGKGVSKAGNKIGGNVGKAVSGVGKAVSGTGKAVSAVGGVGKKVQDIYRRK